MKHVGKQYRFIYPNYGTPSSYPEHVAHSGQVVTVEEIGYADWAGFYFVAASDGWTGWVRDDELNPLHPRKGNIVRLNDPHYINQLYRVDSVGKNSVAVIRLGDNAYMPNCPRNWLF